jgi:hypothetical protein
MRQTAAAACALIADAPERPAVQERHSP